MMAWNMHVSWEGKKARLEISSITQTESLGYQNNQMLPWKAKNQVRTLLEQKGGRF